MSTRITFLFPLSFPFICDFPSKLVSTVSSTTSRRENTQNAISRIRGSPKMVPLIVHKSLNPKLQTLNLNPKLQPSGKSSLCTLGDSLESQRDLVSRVMFGDITGLIGYISLLTKFPWPSRKCSRGERCHRCVVFGTYVRRPQPPNPATNICQQVSSKTLEGFGKLLTRACKIFTETKAWKLQVYVQPAAGTTRKSNSTIHEVM